MKKLGEQEFANICADLNSDRASICRHNPIGTEDEILLWMLLGVLVSYLSLSELETPCLTGKPDAETYRRAIEFVLKNRKEGDFETDKYLDDLTKQ